MKLSSFITSNRERILEEWQVRAKDHLPVPVGSSPNLLRDHLGELLDAVARDLDAASRSAPSPGDRAHTQSTWSNVQALAARHGAGRAHEGTTMNQMVPEFPALRSCVARLWRQTLASATADDLEDLIRFDEAIDLALAQSVSEFTDRLNRSRETFLGILGHDLRNPLATIITGARLMLDDEFDQSRGRDVAKRIVATAERMHQLVIDLLDFTRTRLGGQMPIQPTESNLGALLHSLADEFRTLHPERNIRVQVTGDLRGYWDEERMSQAIGNILANAAHHGGVNCPIEIVASADEHEVTIAVRNEGPPIPEERRKQLFEPLIAANARGKDDSQSIHLGLGLYIAKTIVSGHGGRVDVQSSAEHGTTFTFHLPKGGAAPEVDASSRMTDRSHRQTS